MKRPMCKKTSEMTSGARREAIDTRIDGAQTAINEEDTMVTRGRGMFLFVLAGSLVGLGLVVYADSVNLTTYLRTRDPIRTTGREGFEHLLEDENVNINDTFLANHTEQSGGGTYGDNMAFADFWYDAVHRR